MNDNGQHISLIWQNNPKIILPELKNQWETAISHATSPEILARLIGYATLCERNFNATEEYVRTHDLTHPRALDGTTFITAPTLLNLFPKDQKPNYESLTSTYGVGSNGVCEMTFMILSNPSGDEMHLEARLQFDTDARNLPLEGRDQQYRALASVLFGEKLPQALYTLRTPPPPPTKKKLLES